MIKRFNRQQTVKAALYLVGGMVCCALAYGFFRYLPALVCWQFGCSLPASVGIGMGVVGLLVSWISGIRVWRTRGGLFSYHESGLYHDLGVDTAGAFITDHYAHRVTAPAFILGQIFMAGPLWMLRAWSLLHSRMPDSAPLESSLTLTLEELRAANKWQGIKDYPGLLEEIRYLARMGLIDFSDYKGEPRFKIR